MRRVRFLGAGAALLGLALLVRPGAGGGKEKARPALPPDVFKQLVSHDAGLLEGELAKGSRDTKTARKVRALAFMIAVYADAALDGGGLDTAGLVTLRKNALDLLARAEEGKIPADSALAAKLSPVIKSGGKGPGAKVEAVVWAKRLSFDDVMHQFTSPLVGGLGLEKQLSDLAESRDELTPQELDRLALLGYRLAMIGRVAAAYAAEKKEGGLKTPKTWQDFARQLRAASLALANAARDGKSAKTPAGLDKRNAATRAALDRVNTTCVKCHDVFRQ